MRNDAMRWMIAIAGMLSLVACSTQPGVSMDRDLSMMSHPDLYRGAQYHPHPHGLNNHQADLDLAPGVAYNGCVAILAVTVRDADACNGLDCASAGRISFGPGVRYGDCTVLRAITLAEAESGTGLLCDTEVDQMRA